MYSKRRTIGGETAMRLDTFLDELDKLDKECEELRQALVKITQFRNINSVALKNTKFGKKVDEILAFETKHLGVHRQQPPSIRNTCVLVRNIMKMINEEKIADQLERETAFKEEINNE
jgi:anion-transporting  ArsA/GET3 family ATPase